MYGWRGRIGLILPSKNTVNEPEWRRMLPEGVSLHSARMPIGSSDAAAHERMLTQYERGAELLATADVDVAVFGCTTGSFIGGAGSEAEIESNLSEITGSPAVATAAALRRACRALDLDSVAVATPYLDSINAKEAAYLESIGVDVVDIDGLGIEDPVRMGRQRPEDTYRQVTRLDHAEADGIIISCTNYRTFEIVETLEADLGKPVITSNQATLWNTLRDLDLASADGGPGRLFERTPANGRP